MSLATRTVTYINLPGVLWLFCLQWMQIYGLVLAGVLHGDDLILTR